MTSALAEYIRQIQELEDFCTKSAEPVREPETDYCERAERMIRDAIQSSNVFETEKLSQIDIFAQGSYRNGTNIPTKSDVDVAICYRGAFFYDESQGTLLARLGLKIPATYTYDEFKDDVIRAMQSSFGQEMKIGNKSLKIEQKSGRVGADAVPSFEFRQFQSNNNTQLLGTRFIARDGTVITNWPIYHHYFGVEKNKATGYRYKKVVRVLKTIRRELPSPAAKTPSFLIESMVWNVPDQLFIGEINYNAHSARSLLRKPSLLDNVQGVLQWLYTRDNPADMYEVNRIKPLFSPEQAWTIDDMDSFVYQAVQRLRCWT